MHGGVPMWVVIVILGPLIAAFLLFVGMLFSSRTRGALVLPTAVVFLVFALTAIALLWKSDTFAPILVFAGPWIILIALVVALVRALRKTRE